jgi:hypothetical protein
MLVAAPASGISRLDWLTNAEDDARTDAAERADELAEAAPTDDVESRVGDSNPVKAIEDALRTFPADELIVVTLPDEDADWLEKEAQKPPSKASPFQSHTSSSTTPKPSRSTASARETGRPRDVYGQARDRVFGGPQNRVL